MAYFYDAETDVFYNDEVNQITERMIEVSEEDFVRLIDARNRGCLLFVDGAGKIATTPERPTPNHEWDGNDWVISKEKQTALLVDIQTRLIANIDEHAAKIYSTWTRFESEYRERQAAAEAFKSANYEGECSRYISDFAQRASLDNKTATNLILTQAAGLEKLQVELANQRMRKYELKVPGLTIEKMQSIHDDIIKQMDALMEAYNNG